MPIVLIGVGGIGKTRVVLAALQRDLIKRKFGTSRRFLRYDGPPASLPNFLNPLPVAIGAGVKNVTDIVPFRPYLSSQKVLHLLDNAVLDPQANDREALHSVVEELSQLEDISLLLTDWITTVPTAYQQIEVTPIPIDSARDTFYSIFPHKGSSDTVNTLLERLGFHPPPITRTAGALLA